jgi:hypothetical protein
LRAAVSEAQVLAPASAFGCRATYGSFSLAFCNAPFDNQLTESGRTEADFLPVVTEWLMPGGVLAFVCPEYVVASPYGSARQQLLQWYERLTVLPFPEHCRAYGEVVVLAVKRGQPVEPWRARWEEQQAPEGYRYAIPAGEGPRVFRKVEPTEAEWRLLLAASPLRAHLRLPPPERQPAPPLALGSGHIALLLASGHLDGLVCPPGEPPHAVRGVSRKQTYLASESESEDEEGNVTTKRVYRERIQLVVRAVDATGVIRTFAEQGAGDEGQKGVGDEG